MNGSELVGILGAGTMGAGIAQVAAEGGHQVIIYDEQPEARASARDRVADGLARRVENGTLSNTEKKEIADRVRQADGLQEFSRAEIVVEAIAEDQTRKQALFADLRSILPTKSLLATNTSSLSVTAIAAASGRPASFIGMHFFNPAPRMELVEVVPALQTSSETTARAVEYLRRWKKDPIVVKDSPGFLVNRVARPFYGEALRMVEERVATPEEVDAAMRQCGQFRLGPFELMDLIGNDVNYAVTESIFRATYFDQRYVPSALQRKYVEAGFLGKKSGRGFYTYPRPKSRIDLETGRANAIFMRVLVMLINEAAEALRTGLASKEDIERAMVKGTNYPRGLLHWADEIGINEVLARLHALYEVCGDQRYKSSPLLKQMALDRKAFFA